jgi:hypothetical protein
MTEADRALYRKTVIRGIVIGGPPIVIMHGESISSFWDAARYLVTDTAVHLGAPIPDYVINITKLSDVPWWARPIYDADMVTYAYTVGSELVSTLTCWLIFAVTWAIYAGFRFLRRSIIETAAAAAKSLEHAAARAKELSP